MSNFHIFLVSLADIAFTLFLLTFWFNSVFCPHKPDPAIIIQLFAFYFLLCFWVLALIALIMHGYNFFLKQVLGFLNDIFDTLLKALSDPSDEVRLFL